MVGIMVSRYVVIERVGHPDIVPNFRILLANHQHPSSFVAVRTLPLQSDRRVGWIGFFGLPAAPVGYRNVSVPYYPSLMDFWVDS